MVFLLLVLPLLSSPNYLANAQLPDYCSEENGKIVCVIKMLPLGEPSSYDPEIAEIPEGASVIFKNTGPEIHTATSTDASPESDPFDASSMTNGIFDTGIVNISGGESEAIVLNDSGVFNYFCAVHPDMRGTIIVGNAVATSGDVSSNAGDDSSNTSSQPLEFSTTSSSDTSITGGELPIRKIKSVGTEAYIIDGTTPAGGHDAFSYDGSGHKRITGSIEVDFDPASNTGTIFAQWTDPEGNNWKYEQTKFAGGNEMYIGETMDGITETTLDLDPVAINHFEHGTTGAGPPVEPTLFVYLASWGPAEVFKNGINQGTFEGHMMITEGARNTETGKIVQSDGVTPYSPMTPGNSMVNHNTAQLHLVYHTPTAPEMTNNFPPPYEIFSHTMFYDIDVLKPSVIPAQLEEPKTSPHPVKSMTSKMSPHKQMKNNVNPSDVVCAEKLQLIKKIADGSAACVKSSSAAKLIQMGWGSTF